MILENKQNKNKKYKYVMVCSEYRLELIKTALECLYKESYHNGLQYVLTKGKVRQAMKLFNEIDRLGVKSVFDKDRKERGYDNIRIW